MEHIPNLVSFYSTIVTSPRDIHKEFRITYTAANVSLTVKALKWDYTSRGAKLIVSEIEVVES